MIAFMYYCLNCYDERTQLKAGFFYDQKKIFQKTTLFCLRIQKSIIFVSQNN